MSLGPDGLSLDSVTTEIDETTAACIVQQPDFFGTIQDLGPLVARCREVGALVVVAVPEPVSLGLLKTPGAWGADIAVGEGQPLGLPLNYGGPGVGIMTCKQEHLRQLPGRIVGQTTDHDGTRGFVLTLQAREQHIRREKATSNICTSQTLLALGATVYLASVGPAGLRQAAALSHKAARSLAGEIGKLSGYRVLNAGPVFNEFTVLCPTDGETVRAELLQDGVIGGYPLGRDYPGFERALVFCCTEKNTDAEMSRLVESLGRIGGER